MANYILDTMLISAIFRSVLDKFRSRYLSAQLHSLRMTYRIEDIIQPIKWIKDWSGTEVNKTQRSTPQATLIDCFGTIVP